MRKKAHVLFKNPIKIFLYGINATKEQYLQSKTPTYKYPRMKYGKGITTTKNYKVQGDFFCEIRATKRQTQHISAEACIKNIYAPLKHKITKHIIEMYARYALT